MKTCFVSVIIPAYRAAGTIRRALDSVCAQTRPPDEIVVVDDGSPEDISRALHPYGDRVTLRRKPNGGAASARNFGIEHSRGDFLAFLDADDYWEPAKLERQLAVLRRHPEVGLVASRYFEQTPGEPPVEPRESFQKSLDRVLTGPGADPFEVATKVWTSTVVVRRAALGDRRFDTSLPTAEDRDLWVRMVSSAPVYILSDRLATAVLEPGSLSRSDVDKDSPNMLALIRRNRSLLGRRGVRRWEARLFRQWAGVHLSHGEPHAALAPARERLRRQPFSAQAWWVLLKCAALASTAGFRRRVQRFRPDTADGSGLTLNSS
jgi:glycosyltransferase involved in cell wall biosynthesis